jgi:hypothetical protein
LILVWTVFLNHRDSVFLTFSNISAFIYISWRPVLMVEESGVLGETHRPWQATGKLYHLRLRVQCTLFCNLQSRTITIFDCINIEIHCYVKNCNYMLCQHRDTLLCQHWHTLLCQRWNTMLCQHYIVVRIEDIVHFSSGRALCLQPWPLYWHSHC